MEPRRCFERLVTEDVLDTCDISIRDAVLVVKSSRFYKNLKANPEMTMHYTPREWAESIVLQNNLCRKSVRACESSAMAKCHKTNLRENLFIRSNKNNYVRLMDSIQQLKQGKVSEKALIDD